MLMDFDCFVFMCNIHGFASFMAYVFWIVIYCSSFSGNGGTGFCEFLDLVLLVVGNICF
jgi:hypothetical protein